MAKDKPEPTITVSPATYTPGWLKVIEVCGQGFPNIKRVNVYSVAPGHTPHFWGWKQPKNGGFVVREDLLLPEGHPAETWEIQASDEDGAVLATAKLVITD